MQVEEVARVLGMATTGVANDEFAAGVMSSACEALMVEAGCLYVVEPGGTLLRREGWYGSGLNGLPAQMPLDASHLVARAARERRPAFEVSEEGGRAALALVLGAELLGVLALSFPAARASAACEFGPLQMMANVLAVAVGRTRWEAKPKPWSPASMQRSLEATLAIANALEVVPENHIEVALRRGFRVWPYALEPSVPEFLRDALTTIVKEACTALVASFGALGFGTCEYVPFDPWVFFGVSEEQVAAIGRTPRPVGTLGVVALQGESVRVRDVREHPKFRGFPPGHPEITSVAATPIEYAGLTLGNLYVGNKMGAPEFSEEDLEILKTIAKQAGQALQIAFLRAAIDVQRAQLQSAIDCAPTGILFVDGATGNVMANPRAMDLVGITLLPTAGVAQFLPVMCHPDGRSLSLDELPSHAALRGETVIGREMLVCRRDGRRVPVLVNAAPVHAVDWRNIGAVVVFEEISALKELGRLREELAAVIAHDLRGPIQVIQMQAQSLIRAAEDGTVHAPVDAIRRIERNVARLREMADDLTDASLADLKRFSLDRRSVAPQELVTATLERMRPGLGAHPVEISAEQALPVLSVDIARFDQILSNLLDNAAKYSGSEAPIRIHLAPERGGLLLSVEDHGMGIASQEIPRLFDRFYQCARSREMKSGLGLGLYIVKALVEAHEGRIWVDSRVDEGSTFHVWLPAAAAPPTTAVSPPTPGAAPIEKHA
jgi:signal transduction histidine kinase